MRSRIAPAAKASRHDLHRGIGDSPMEHRPAPDATIVKGLMACDHFAVLGQPRRPWLDPDQLKQKYQQLTFEQHPDRANKDAGEADFAAVTEAYQVLSNQRLRVLHLLSLETNEDVAARKTSTVPNELADIFMDSAVLVQQIDTHCQKREQTGSALGKAVLQAENAELQKRAQELLKQLESCYSAGLGDLRRLDETWTEHSSSRTNELRAVADRFGYLERWIIQLRERQFHLSN